MNLPNPPPTGIGPLDQWLHRMHSAVRGMYLRNGPGWRLKRTPQGTIAEILTQKSALKIKVHRYKSMAADHLVCRSYDGTTEGTTDVLIAKVDKLRNSILTETLRGVIVNYSAWDNTLNGQTRVATQQGGSVVETQYITPPYLVNDLIWAVSTYTGVNVPNSNPVQKITLLDLNIAAREWATF